MSKAIFVECKQSEANAVHCEQCEGDRSSFHEGEKAVRAHAESFPLHTRITPVRLEVA